MALQTDAMLDDTTALTPKFAGLYVSSGMANLVVNSVSAKKLRVLAYTLVASNAVTARFSGGVQSLTGAMALAANGGVSAGFVPVGHFETAAGVGLELTLGGNVNVDGHLTYVEV